MHPMRNQLIPIITPYFEWLTEHFGHLAREAIKNNVDASTIARDYLSNSTRRQHFRAELPQFYQSVRDFWQANGKAIHAGIRTLPGLKARFGGDIGPQTSDSIFQKVGLYFESIIVPDPLLRVARLPEGAVKTKDYYFLKYSIAHVMLKDVYLADVYPPIAVLEGDVEMEGSNLKDNAGIAEFDSVFLINDLYGENFDNFTEVQKFFSRFGSVREAITEAQKPELLYWDEDTPSDPLQQWEANIRRSNIDWKLQELPQMQGINLLLSLIQGRMMQVNSVLFGASTYDANPLMATPVSFHWLNWKSRVNRNLMVQNSDLENDVDLKLTNALLSKDLNWLSNVPIKSLIELRKKGQLSELRSVINQEIERLACSPIDTLGVIAKQVDYNLVSALEKHQEEVESLNETFRSGLVFSGASFLLGVVGALQPLFPIQPEWVATLGTIAGTAGGLSIISVINNYLKEKKAFGRTPMGILWKAKKNFQENEQNLEVL
jgi:hypothetical protein